MTEDQIDRLIYAMRLGKAPLWGLGEIAEYFGISVTTVRAHITCAPDFPRPVSVTGDAKSRRWKPDEVEAWGDKRREVMPRPRRRAA